MARCEAKAGRLGCKLEQGHDEPFGPPEVIPKGGKDKRPRRATPHTWAGKCDSCREGPVIRLHEDKDKDGKVTFLHLCGRCEDRGGSVTSGMIVNRHPCACGEPATRWIESIQTFLCDSCGPDKEKLGAQLKPEDFAKMKGPLVGLFPIRAEGDFFNLFEVKIAEGKVIGMSLLLDRCPYWEVLDVMRQRHEERVTEGFTPRPADPPEPPKETPKAVAA